MKFCTQIYVHEEKHILIAVECLNSDIKNILKMVYKIIEKLQRTKLLAYTVYASSTSYYVSSVGTKLSAKRVIDFTNSYFHSLNKINQSFRIDFINSNPYIEKIILTSAIQRDPYHWKIEGSTDGSYFVDLVINNGKKLCKWGTPTVLETSPPGIGCEENEEKTFSIEPGYYQSIRMIQTGTDSNGQHYLTLSGIEFLGRIDIMPFTCFSSGMKQYFVNLYLLVIIN